jgi:hypothetical protein
MKRNQVGRKPLGWEAQILATEIQNVNLEGGSSGSAVHNLVGSTHVVSGLDAGPPSEFLGALTPTTYGFKVVADADLPATIARTGDIPTAGHIIKDEGGAGLTQRANLNFAGAGVTATDDAGNDATMVTIPGGGASITMLLGDGSDGDVTIAVDTELVRPMYYNTLVVNVGIKLITNGYSIFVRNPPLENNGGIYEVDPATIDGSAGGAGTDVAGGLGGTACTNALLPMTVLYLPVRNGPAGVDGGFNAVGADGQPGAATDVLSTYVDAASGLIGAAGGAGDSAGGAAGFADNCAGQAAGYAYSGFLNSSFYKSLPSAVTVGTIIIFVQNVIAYFLIYGNNGGAAGGGGGAGCGGGGGGGSGWNATHLKVFANTITGSGCFYCNGGNGGDGGAGYGGGAGTAGGGGGGPGGNGGIILLGYGSKAGTWTTDVTGGTGGDGGAGGNGGDPGGDGPDGQTGVVIELSA